MSIWLMLALMAPETQPPLAPSSKWVAEYEEELCVISREFGKDAQKVTFALRPLPLASDMEVVLIRDNGESRAPMDGPVTMTQDSGSTISARYNSAYHPGLKKRIFSFDVDRTKLGDLRLAKTIMITLNKRNPITIAPHFSDAALKTLTHCENQLIESWGIPLAEKEKIVTDARGQGMENWVTDDDYPGEAVAAHQRGTSSILWTIETNGRIGDCKVVRTSGYPVLDEAACKAITRKGRYTPARDKDGKPVRSWSSRRVRWVLP